MIMTTIAISSDVLNSVKIPRGYQEWILKPELALAFYQGALSPSTGWEKKDYGASSDDFYYMINFYKILSLLLSLVLCLCICPY